MSDLFTLTQRIYIEDVDSTGIVYHANYLKYMERARTEWLLYEGYHLLRLAEEDVQFVIREAQVMFYRPILLNALIEIGVSVKDTSRTTLDFMQNVRDKENPELIYATGNIKAVCVTKALKPRRLPETLNLSISAAMALS